MTNVFVDMSMSLDGFIAGPNDGRENPLGEGGERLPEWVFDLASWREQQGLDGGKTNRDDEIVAESIERIGAHVMGRRMFDNDDGPWGDEPFEGYWGETRPFTARCSSLRTTLANRSRWTAGRRSTSSQTGSNRPWSRPRRRPTTETFGSRVVRTSSANTSRQDSLTRYSFSSCPCYSAMASGCSSTSPTGRLNWNERGW